MSQHGPRYPYFALNRHARRRIWRALFRGIPVANLRRSASVGRVDIGDAGTFNGNTAVTRHNPDGTLDASFDFNGKVAIDAGMGRDELATGVAIQTDGKIVVVGDAFVNDDFLNGFFVFRLNSDGSLDPGFANGGIHLQNVTTSDWTATAVAIDTDGSIVVSGNFETDEPDGTRTSVSVVRFNSDGSFDTDFNGYGVHIVELGDDIFAQDVAIQPDGRIVVAGYERAGIDPEILVMRFLPDGNLDPSFAGDGYRTATLNVIGQSARSKAESIVIQPDGGIIVAGEVGSPLPNGTMLARFNSNGSLDQSFSYDGMAVTADVYGRRSLKAQDVALQQGGNIVVVGAASGDWPSALWPRWKRQLKRRAVEATGQCRPRHDRPMRRRPLGHSLPNVTRD